MATLKFTAQATQLINASGNAIGTSLIPLIITPALGSSAFGLLKIAQEHVVVHGQFVYNVNTVLHKVTEASSGTVTQGTSMAVLTTSTNTAGSAILESKAAGSYDPGVGLMVRFTALFTAGKASSTQYLGFLDLNDGFGFGYNGTAFGILHRQGGSDTWIPQASWNGADIFDGNGATGVTLDPTKGNVFAIQVQYLGFGTIRFFIENPNTGEFHVVHTLRYPNANVRPHINQASLPLFARVLNAGNDTSLVMKIGSWSIAAEIANGSTEHVIRGATAGSKTLNTATQTPILSLRCKATYQTITNRIRIRLLGLNVSVGGNRDAQLFLHLNPTTHTDASFVDFSANTHVADVDTSATAASGGTNVYGFSVDSGTAAIIDLSERGYILNPGDVYTVTCATLTAGGNVVPQVTMIWEEHH